METHSELTSLLEWLKPSSEGDATGYLEVRSRLAALFRLRGCVDAEEMADETLDRTARAILRPGFVYEGNPIAYLRAVARNVHLEWLRRERKLVHLEPGQADCERLPDRSAQLDAEKERTHQCLDRCLDNLPKPKRAMLLRYYDGEKSAKIDGRATLAAEYGLELNALRIQIFRLRTAIRTCVQRCVNSNEMAQPI